MSVINKIKPHLRWLPSYVAQSSRRGRPAAAKTHLIIALADHFEPSIMPGASGTFAPRVEQLKRLKQWCSDYPKAVDRFRDSDGHPFKHTYFSPAEQYDKEQLDILAEHCQGGWGEI